MAGELYPDVWQDHLQTISAAHQAGPRSAVSEIVMRAARAIWRCYSLTRSGCSEAISPGAPCTRLHARLPAADDAPLTVRDRIGGWPVSRAKGSARPATGVAMSGQATPPADRRGPVADTERDRGTAAGRRAGRDAATGGHRGDRTERPDHPGGQTCRSRWRSPTGTRPSTPDPDTIDFQRQERHLAFGGSQPGGAAGPPRAAVMPENAGYAELPSGFAASSGASRSPCSATRSSTCSLVKIRSAGRSQPRPRPS